MIVKWRWLLGRLMRKLWVRASLLSLVAVATALLAVVLAPFVPSDLPTRIGSDAVDGILNILASSLLAVTIFSLSTAVGAFGNAAQNVTPRVTALLLEDATTQNALATFLGAFLFSLVGLIALATGVYGSQGRVILFVVTVLMIALIVVTLLRWIDRLSKLGTVSDATRRVEQAATNAIVAYFANPHLGGQPLADPINGIPASARPVRSSKIGYVQHVDARALSQRAEKCGGQVYVTVLPGRFVDPSLPLARVLGFAADQDDFIRAAFTIGDERSFDQDPRFGLAVLAEIASRALSPAVNDAGTAIDVIGRAVRVLSASAGAERQRSPGECPYVYAPAIDVANLFDDAFYPIARDGAGVVEVQLSLQKALLALARLDERYARQAAIHAAAALARAESALALDAEKARVRAIAEITMALGR